MGLGVPRRWGVPTVALMAPRRRIAAFAAATALVGSPAGLASTPSSTQYGNQLTQESPSGQVLGDEAGDGLPFTGLQAGLILVGGLTLVVGGLALRRLGRDRT